MISKKIKPGYIVFALMGILVCICSGFYNSFYAILYNVPIEIARVEIAPLVEEVIKFIPLLCYLLIWNPSEKALVSANVILAISFAVSENIAYLLDGGMVSVQVIVVRCLSVTALHVLISMITAQGLVYAGKWEMLKFVNGFAVLCIAVAMHGQFNLMMYAGGILQCIASLLSVLCLFLIIFKKNKKHEN